MSVLPVPEACGSIMGAGSVGTGGIVYQHLVSDRQYPAPCRFSSTLGPGWFSLVDRHRTGTGRTGRLIGGIRRWPANRKVPGTETARSFDSILAKNVE